MDVGMNKVTVKLCSLCSHDPQAGGQGNRWLGNQKHFLTQISAGPLMQAVVNPPIQPHTADRLCSLRAAPSANNLCFSDIARQCKVPELESGQDVYSRHYHAFAWNLQVAEACAKRYLSSKFIKLHFIAATYVQWFQIELVHVSDGCRRTALSSPGCDSDLVYNIVCSFCICRIRHMSCKMCTKFYVYMNCFYCNRHRLTNQGT
jgi:hypothetical protein